MKKTWIAIVAVVAALGVGATSWYAYSARKSGTAAGTAKVSYEYTQAKKGSIEKSISTSGTLQPVSTVKVVAMMSGKAEKVYADYNDEVKKGQVLVSLNTDMLRLQELQSQASLQKAQANYELQAANYANKKALADKGLVSDYDLSSAKTSMSVAAAELASAKASYQVIETELNQYALVKSPIDGIVLDKNVEVGQTVVEGSSSSSSALFTLAEDLSKMEIKASVDELDIPSVKVGQKVRFTVESQSGVEFEGSVKEIHLVPVTSNNVVSYYVIVEAPNKGSSLLPGMTANIEFIEERKDDVLLVPNSALRYSPSSLDAEAKARLVYLAGIPASGREAAAAEYDEARKAQVSAAAKTGGQSSNQASGLASLVMGGGTAMGNPGLGGPGMGAGGPPGEGGGQSTTAKAASGTTQATGSSSTAATATATRKPLWYLDSEGSLACVLVEVGITDGVNTQVSSSEDLSALKLILRERAE